jgi:hypothetical protein
VAAPLNPNQLKMFMTPREIGGYVTDYGDFGTNPGGLPHEAFRRLNDERALEKDTNAGRSGLSASIAREGVKKPIDIGHGTSDAYEGKTILWNGHHRLQEQSIADPDRLMPVVHTTPFEHQWHGRTKSGFPDEGATYRTFGMGRTQLEDPEGVKR